MENGKEEVVQPIDIGNGLLVCPHCLAGEIRYLGGPCGVGIGGAGDPNVVFLHQCDICHEHFVMQNERERLDIVRRYEGQWDNINRRYYHFEENDHR